MTDYKEKYIKYKAKYLALRGGVQVSYDTNNFINNFGKYLNINININIFKELFKELNDLLALKINDKEIEKREQICLQFLLDYARKNDLNTFINIKPIFIEYQIFILKIYTYKNIFNKLSGEHLTILYSQEFVDDDLKKFDKILENDDNKKYISILIEKKEYSPMSIDAKLEALKQAEAEKQAKLDAVKAKEEENERLIFNKDEQYLTLKKEKEKLEEKSELLRKAIHTALDASWIYRKFNMIGKYLTPGILVAKNNHTESIKNINKKNNELEDLKTKILSAINN